MKPMTKADVRKCTAAADSAVPYHDNTWNSSCRWLNAFNAEALRLGYRYEPQAPCRCEAAERGHLPQCGYVTGG